MFCSGSATSAANGKVAVTPPRDSRTNVSCGGALAPPAAAITSSKRFRPAAAVRARAADNLPRDGNGICDTPLDDNDRLRLERLRAQQLLYAALDLLRRQPRGLDAAA